MSHLLFIRHGQDEDNANNILNGHREMPLTAFGQEQVRATARQLSLLQPDVIYASPLRRTQETAKILSELLGIRRVISEPALIERDFGVLTGKTYDDIPTYATKWLQLPNYRYFVSGEGIEPFEAVRERVGRLRIKIIASHPNERVLIVSHGDVYKMFLAECQGLTIEAALRTPFIENASISDFGLQTE